jgi:predicted amidohydrolase
MIHRNFSMRSAPLTAACLLWALAAARAAGAVESAPCGRPVRIVSVAVYGRSVAETSQIVAREAAAGADLIVLPEVWPGANKQFTLQDPPIAAMAELARRHKTYIVSPIYRRDGDAVFNSSVLIDRHGKIAGVYDKLYPVMHEPNGKGGEFAGVKLAGVKGRSGSDAPVFQTDFGRVGMAICFDGQFPEVWQRLEDNGAQIVLFSSMYSAGRSLGAYATLHHYYVVSCCNWGECLAYDMTGDRLLAQRKDVSRIVLDMDRRMVHLNDANNHVGKNNGRIAKLLAENPGVVVDTFMPAEDWEVLKAVRPGVDVPALMEKYGIRDLRTYLRGQRQEADRIRSGPFK